ncbi:hydrolase [Acidomonas methanolica NBRC 104435]|uniref:Hydrolase n=2 Tax=Acidomonas methanolica TaxID=437 RepID=A0A023D3R5_ACIMT|nr:HAD family hydrolase [Acidomonas methanolica]GAJ28699.1 hydrolase [Acidomonas methanolica NBRC 104435]GEK98311.1 glycerol-3-phosphatase [Acidomonas methanolica NBRC 104435]
MKRRKLTRATVARAGGFGQGEGPQSPEPERVIPEPDHSVLSPLLLQGRHFDAFLFDMDGTILTSIIAAERVWGAWARRHGLDVERFLPTIHGVRTEETIRRNRPDLDAGAEARWITEREIEDVEGIDEIPGAVRLLRALPPERWAIVTSAPRALAERRIAVAGLPMPRILIAAEDVSRGKPAPDPFLLAARKLGVDPARCLVFEDAPAGVASAEAAGATVVVVTHTHQHPIHILSGADHASIPHYRDLDVVVSADGTLGLEARTP